MRTSIVLALFSLLGVGAASRVSTFPPFDPSADIGKAGVIGASGYIKWDTATGVTGSALAATGATTANDIAVFADTGRRQLKDSGVLVSTIPPLTTKGDIAGFAAVATRVPVGATGQLLIADSTNANGVSYAYEHAGVLSNSNAAAGIVGEVLGPISRVQSNATNLTTGVTVNVGTTTSITLTSGDWEIDSTVSFYPTASTTVSVLLAGVSAISATLPGTDTFSVPTAGEVQVGFNIKSASFTTASPMTLAMPRYRVSVTSASTKQLFLVAQGAFGVSTLTVGGWMEARRVH
jgi:hypothetical protein